MSSLDASRGHFAIVLAGGGARGFSHAGVLRALDHYGLRPSAIVGVSMGAVVGVAYALRTDWYHALLDAKMGTRRSPFDWLPSEDGSGFRALPDHVRRLVARARGLRRVMTHWGPDPVVLETGLEFLAALYGDASLEDGRTPVAVSATDLRSGDRVVFTTGPAVQRVYASSALAGVVPPVEDGGRLLADGAYSDVAPVDVARSFHPSCVLAVDPGQIDRSAKVRNGLEAMLRASEVCYTRHSELRFNEADLVIRPAFRRPIDTLEFDAKREAVAAGIRGVIGVLPTLRAMLGGTSVSHPVSRNPARPARLHHE